ncbi:divalent cation tolerance protein, CutA1 domain protein [Leptospira interrogans serovar Icterohaemorrhagiae str. Verdun HP]|nr:divalent cation tolerance protein, CutA1 domain protein [Leptospira interrogans serovar Icterohaemorrhagiae str. Verdun HP]
MTEVILRVKSLHSYSVPCIVSLPLLEGNKDYFSWIYSEVLAD